MALQFDCRSRYNFCHTTSSNCSLTTGLCDSCAPGWQHSNLFIVANDCMQPTWFPIVMLIVCSCFTIPSLILSVPMFLSSHHLPPETYTVGGWAHLMWSKQLLVKLNVAFQAAAFGIGLACYTSSRPWVGMLWCFTGMMGLSIMYGVKQRLVHPALVMHRDAGRRRRCIEKVDWIMFLCGTGIIMMGLDLAGVGGFLGLDDFFNIGILGFLLAMEFFQLTSLLEMIWMARQVKQLCNSLQTKTLKSSKDLLHGSKTSASAMVGVGGRYRREGSKEYMDDLDFDVDYMSGDGSDDNSVSKSPMSPRKKHGSPDHHRDGATKHTPPRSLNNRQFASTQSSPVTSPESRTKHIFKSAESDVPSPIGSPIGSPTIGSHKVHSPRTWAIHVSAEDLNRESDSAPTATYIGDHDVHKMGQSMIRVASIGKAAIVLFISFQPLIAATMAFPVFGTLPFAWGFASVDILISSLVMTLLTYRVVGTDHLPTYNVSKQSSRRRDSDVDFHATGR